MQSRNVIQRIFTRSLDNEVRNSLHAAVAEFRSFSNGEQYFNRSKYTGWRNRYGYLGNDTILKIKRFLSFLGNNAPDTQLLAAFFNFYNKGEQILVYYNKEFVSGELVKLQQFFDTIEKYPLDIKQREAVICDEDNNLIIAGAGTGKTTTIVGKYAYLVERLGVAPEEILLLAFTEKAAAEMRARIRDRMKDVLDKDIEVNAKTFHSLGLGIIAEVRNFKPDLGFDSEVKLRSFMQDVYDELSNDEKYRKLLVDYLVEYLKPYKPPEAFRSKGEYFTYLRSNNILTLQREEVKSYEEAQIANFLFLHNIQYEYETPYKHTTRSKHYRQYRPDFYLPEYDIYIEHWGVDRQGEVPEWFGEKEDSSATERYQSKMEWARELHRLYGTTLVETY